jgi:hypothetical protein
MPTSLLDIALVYHADDKAALKYANAIDSAFAYMPLDGSLSDFADVEDPWRMETPIEWFQPRCGNTCDCCS